MPYPFGLIACRRALRSCLFTLGWLVLFPLQPPAAWCAVDIPVNHLERLAVHPKVGYTRIVLTLQDTPLYTISIKAGNRLRIRLLGTTGPRFRYLRSYSDRAIGGLVLAQRGPDLTVTFAMAPTGVGWRAVHLDGVPALCVDVGPSLVPPPLRPSLPGRERIWSGAGRLLRDFDPPIKPEIPFVPTDRKVLKGLLSEDDQKLFLTAEGALYKGQLTAAEDIFSSFAARTGTPIQPLALYRLAETRYRLQRYPEALQAFREAEQLWPAFLSFNPASMFYYGDSIARSGDLPGALHLLTRLIITHADKEYAPVLLVRMGDVLLRQGNELRALAIYRTVADAFKGNKARQIARMKLADQQLLQATPFTYRALADIYRDIAARAGDYDLREEASFKAMLLAALNARADEALAEAVDYQRHFPNGSYSSVLHDIREDLVAQRYLQGGWDKDPAGLVTLTQGNQDYLAVAVQQPGFLPSVTTAFATAGRPLDLIALYMGLLERSWCPPDNLPYLYLQVAEKSEQLGDNLLAKRMLGNFLTRFPADPLAHLGRERLAALQYLDGELSEVRLNLLWLFNKGEEAQYPISYYYLGRSLWQAKGYAQAAQAMDRYLAAVSHDVKNAPLVPDAYYTDALARQALRQYPQAQALLEAALKVVPPVRRDQFTYKLGEVNLQSGNQAQARGYFEQLAQKGGDPDWRRLAAQTLQSLPPAPPASSKNQKVK